MESDVNAHGLEICFFSFFVFNLHDITYPYAVLALKQADSTSHFTASSV